MHTKRLQPQISRRQNSGYFSVCARANRFHPHRIGTLHRHPDDFQPVVAKNVRHLDGDPLVALALGVGVFGLGRDLAALAGAEGLSIVRTRKRRSRSSPSRGRR